MPLAAAAVWELLTAVGGAAAFAFIIALALAIGALTLFFLGSSVVVLEGFARGARRWRTVAVLVVVWALLGGLLLADSESFAGLLPADFGALPRWLVGVASTAVFTTAFVLLARLALWGLASAALARASLVVLGAGYALITGGSARLAYAAAPALATAAVAAVLALRRRRSGPAGELERGLWLLSGVLAVGIALAAALPAPRIELARVGVLLVGVFLAAVVLGLLPLAAAGFVEARGTAEWFIALRYLLAKRRQTFISVISLICAGGVAAGVWLIITVLSVMNGFERVWRDEIIGIRAHVLVQSGLGTFDNYEGVLATVLADPEVVGASPFLDAEGMVRGNSGQIVGVRVRGVDPSLVGDVTSLESDVIAGSLSELELLAPVEGESGSDGQPVPGIAISSELAVSLGLGVGDPLLLVSPFGGPPTPFGPAPRLHRFRVASIFRSSFFQYDEVLTYVSLASAQQFLRTDDVVQGIEVRVRDFYRSKRVAAELQAELGFPFYTRDWKEFFPAFFQALKTEQVMMFVLLTFIMVVASFVIVATLIMMIMEKSSDIAILKAMGATDESIERIFAIEGTLIGLLGTVVGVVAGTVVTTQLSWIQEQVESITGIDTLPATVYQLSTLPWEIDLWQIAGVAAIAMILSLGATLLPSRQGARLDPAEALRYE